MKKNLLLSSLCLLLLSTVAVKAQNINNSLRVAPSSPGNGYISLPGLSLDTMDFTVEMWIKVDSDTYSGTSPFNDPSILGNKDWVDGSNKGLEIAVYTNSNYKVNFTPNGLLVFRSDVVSSGPSLEGRWNHIAVSFERNGYIRLYTNGILTDSLNISSSHGHSIDVSMPYNLCDDGTGSYSHPFSGNIDEFRIWKGVRSTSEIRKYMCRRLPSGTANMLVYLPMDQTTGTTVTDMSGNGIDGVLTNLTASAWTPSGAALGDTSMYIYTSTWTSQSLTVTSPGSGTFLVDSISTGMQGIQVYRTNYAPNSNTGITIPGTDSVYFGVYPVNENSTYNVTYTYSGYANAMSHETGISVFRRPNLYNAWSTLTTTKSTSAHKMHATGISKYNHFVIGNLTGAPVTFVTHTSNTVNNIKAYPNPTNTGNIYFESNTNEKTVLSLFNSQGRLLQSVSINSWPYTLDVSALPSGMYFASCTSASGRETLTVNIIR